MKKIIAVVLFFACVWQTKAQKTIVKDDNAISRSISGSFNAIKISGGIDLYLSQSETEAVAVSASDATHRENIKTVVEGNTLKIYYDGNGNWNTGNKKLKAYVSFKTLQHLEGSGASDIQVAGYITTPLLVLHMSGASDFKGAIAADDLKVELSGASDATLTGTVKKLQIESSGASDVKGFDLVAESCEAKASGASDIKITVTKEFKANASGASDISYKGDPSVTDKSSSGASSINKRG